MWLPISLNVFNLFVDNGMYDYYLDISFNFDLETQLNFEHEILEGVEIVTPQKINPF